jgi:hypothetical protein
MAKKYMVRLAEEERAQLGALLNKGRASAPNCHKTGAALGAIREV